MSDYYEWYKVCHIIAVISWMVGLLYMPRLFVYHSKILYDSEADKIFRVMEKRLLKLIMNPAMIATYVFGLTNAYIYGFSALGIWFHIKMLTVLILSGFHGFLANCVKKFEKGENKLSEKFFRVINEVPTLMMIVAVIMVIVKPFE